MRIFISKRKGYMDIFEEKRQLIEKIACQKEDTLESKLELKQLLLKDTNGGKLYKYRSFDKDGYSLKNLEEGTLHCSLVEAFNDPFDSKFGYSFEALYKEMSRDYEKEISEKMYIFEQAIYVLKRDKEIEDFNKEEQRKINKLLHNNHSHKVVFNDICEVLSDILESNILVISKKGKVLGVAIHEGVDEIEELIKDQVGGFVDRMLNERLLSVLSTKENVNLATLGFAEENVKKYQAIITPIDISGERLGTLFIYKSDAQYDIDDIILSEYGTTVVGLEMMRSVNEENAEETRKIQIVKSAISTLSFSELEAITHIFDELEGNEGILVASKIADRVGITRSVIVNALRKFESAGVIESRSSGMKGTYIKVLNDVVFDELKALKAQNNRPSSNV